MNNLLTDLYNNGALPNALLLVTDPANATQLVEGFCSNLQLNPADFLLLTEPTSLKVADAKIIRQFTEKTRFTSPIKLVFLADANLLTIEAANSLLKTLEEPPEGSHFILAVRRPDELLPTVRSRCQILNLNTINPIDESVPTLAKTNLFESFSLAKDLAAGDTPLPHIFNAWLQQATDPGQQQLLLTYLPWAHTPVNRRLLLDNFFLDLYNTDER